MLQFGGLIVGGLIFGILRYRDFSVASRSKLLFAEAEG